MQTNTQVPDPQLLKTKNKISETVKFPALFAEKKDLLMDALLAARLEMPVIFRSAKNSYTNSTYADLTDIITQAEPILLRNELLIVQTTYCESGVVYLQTRLVHSSGQSIASVVPLIPAKNDPQAFGSCLTYQKRYQICLIAGLVTGDDDGNAATYPSGAVSKPQLAELASAFKRNPDLLDPLLREFRIEKIADLPAKKHTKMMDRIKELVVIKKI